MVTKALKKEARNGFERLNISRFMERDVQSVRSDATASSIAAMMVEGFGAVPVIDETDRLVGIVSEYDLLRSLEQGHRWSTVLARDIMAPNPYSVREEMNMATLVHVLVASDLIRVPVVDGNDRLVGIVARRDIVRAYLNYDGDRTQ